MQPHKLSEERLEYYRNEHLTVTETSFLQHIAYQDQRIKELEEQSAAVNEVDEAIEQVWIARTKKAEGGTRYARRPTNHPA